VVLEITAFEGTVTTRRKVMKLARAKHLGAYFPKPVKNLLRRFFPFEGYLLQSWEMANEYRATRQSEYRGSVDVKLGIIKEFTHQHKHYIGACRELMVPYEVVDISGPDWIDIILNCDCDGYLVWPSAYITVWKQMFEERLRVMKEYLGKIIYPSYEEIWFYESKRKVYAWLKVNGFAHPRTWVFYNEKEALEFARVTELPIVFKTDLGATATGVKILRTRPKLVRLVKRCFKRGVIRKNGDPRDRQWGLVILQEYLPNISEWRMIRVGDSYFGYEKLRVGDFHSGSHQWRYSKPPQELLDLLKEITDKGGFSSMDLDVFVTRDGRYLVNEMQSLFGLGNPYEMCVVDGKAGRMVYDSESGAWKFEEGSFCRNHLCNERVRDFLRKLDKVSKGADKKPCE